MRKAFLSGPMTGVPDFNRPAFNLAAAELRSGGWTVWNPAELDGLNTFISRNPDKTDTFVDYWDSPDQTWADYLGANLAQLPGQDVVFVLPGWQASQGSRVEVAAARELSIPIIDFVPRVCPEPSGSLCNCGNWAGGTK